MENIKIISREQSISQTENLNRQPSDLFKLGMLIRYQCLREFFIDVKWREKKGQSGVNSVNYTSDFSWFFLKIHLVCRKLHNLFTEQILKQIRCKMNACICFINFISMKFQYVNRNTPEKLSMWLKIFLDFQYSS